MAFNANQFRELISTVITGIALYSPAAEELLLGTAAVESDFGTNLMQLGGGPGTGVFSIEPNTEHDIWINHLRYRPERTALVAGISGVTGPDPWALRVNLAYQIVIARLKYRMISEPLPLFDDLQAQARYWDDHYNANPVKGFPAEYVAKYRRYVR